MALRDCAVVVLAAGKGTRLKSRLAKVLHRVGGRPLVEHTMRACLPLEPATIVVVVGHQAAEVRAVVEPFGAKTVLQEPQLGTGHALLMAQRALEGCARCALVLPGDAPLVRTGTLLGLTNAHSQGRAAVTILTAKLDDPTGYGRILRKRDGSVAAIIEEKAASAELRAIREVNSSIYVFTLEKLWPVLAHLKPQNVHRELYLTDAIALLDSRGECILAEVAPDPREILGCNTRAELAHVDRILRENKRAEAMEAGATLCLPETILIDPDVEIGPDTVIEPGVQLLGATRVGPGCTVRAGSVLVDTVLEEGVVVKQNCHIAGSWLGAGVQVGPFAHIRDGAELRAGSRVGNFVEVKKSTLGEGVKAMHLSYLGDARIGPKSNIGAGTITCNYDGVRKNPTTIGAHVFVGSGTELVAPVNVGDGAYIAAGSTITEDVPSNALAIARERQVTKPGWAAEHRKQTGAGADVAKDGPSARSAVSSKTASPNGQRGPKASRKPARRKKVSRR